MNGLLIRDLFAGDDLRGHLAAVQAEAGCNRVFGVAVQGITPFGDRGDFAANLGIGVEVVEHITGGVQQIDLKSCNQRTQ